MKYIILSMICLCLTFTSLSQQLVMNELTPIGPFRGTLKILDVNNDGNLDVIVFGDQNQESLGGIRSVVFRNNGDGFSSCDHPAGLTSGMVNFGGNFQMPEKSYFLDMKLADLNNDGFVDIFATSGRGVMSTPFFNLGNNSFEWRDAGFNPTTEVKGQSGLADFNNDGLVDVVVVGAADGNFDRTAIFYNTGNNTDGFPITRKVSLTIPNNSALYDPEVKVIDFNNDGFSDIWVTGWNARWDPRIIYSYMLINNKNETFAPFESILGGISPKANSSSDWSDYDGDGFPDLVIMGDDGATDFTARVYKNSNGTSMSLVASFDGYYPHNIGGGCRFIDIDNDGDKDFILCGKDQSGTNHSDLYLNNNGTFSKASLFSHIPGYVEGSMDFADIDNNGTLDIVMNGISNLNPVYFPVIAIDNQLMAFNSPPSIPTNLNVTKVNNQYAFTWDASTDTKTPSQGISYNLYIRNKYSKKLIVAPNSNIDNGKRFITDQGNVGQKLSKTISLSGDISQYEWSVQAIDFCYAASAFAMPSDFSGITTAEAPRFRKFKYIYHNHQISFTGTDEGQISIFSVNGILLDVQKYVGIPLNIKDYGSGVLLVKFISNQGVNVFSIIN